MKYLHLKIPTTVLLLGALPAFAMPTLTISDGVHTDTFSSSSPIIVSPNPITLDAWTITGQVIYDGTPTLPFWAMDVLAQSAVPGTLTVTFTYDNLPPTSHATLTAENGGSVLEGGATVNETITAEPSGSPSISVSGLPGPSHPVTVNFSSATPYSLVEKLTISNPQGAILMSTDSSGIVAQAAPDSADTLFLLGAGLVCLGMFPNTRHASKPLKD
jgi:hypothetical protein